MKIDIKPTIIIAPDYHDFTEIQCHFEDFDIQMKFHEIYTGNLGYDAIFWPEGAEDELFEFIFTNKEVWDILTTEE
jgi:hypothetical protein